MEISHAVLTFQNQPSCQATSGTVQSAAEALHGNKGEWFLGHRSLQCVPAVLHFHETTTTTLGDQASPGVLVCDILKGFECFSTIGDCPKLLSIRGPIFRFLL